MFTGIVEEIGTVRAIRTGKSGALLEIEASKVLEGTAVGDSIAVNGVCLTVTPGHGSFTADAMPETLRRTGHALRGTVRRPYRLRARGCLRACGGS